MENKDILLDAKCDVCGNLHINFIRDKFGDLYCSACGNHPSSKKESNNDINDIKISIDGFTAEIETLSRTILIRNYTLSGGVKENATMTITYPENWGYTRAMQHATMLLESFVKREII